MDAWLSLAGLAIAATDAGLLVLAWRQRAAISAVAGLAETRGGAGRSGIYRGRRGADPARGRGAALGRSESPCSRSVSSSSDYLTRPPTAMPEMALPTLRGAEFSIYGR